MSLIISLLAGCTPSCKDVCAKVIACENAGTERMSEAECEVSCIEQRDLYARWTDTQLREDFDDQLTCLYESECEEIEAGACYSESTFSF